jgi:hypothetical protein
LATLFTLPEDFARQFYLVSGTGEPLPPDETDGQFSVTALVWTVLDDPTSPVLINEWLIRNGLAFVDGATAERKFKEGFVLAEQEAQEEGIGVWGACAMPLGLVAPPDEPEGRVMQVQGNGDRVIPFTITTEETYLLTLNVTAADAVFVAADVYALDGTSLPALSMSTAESGTFSSAGFLPSGEYYAQIKAVGAGNVPGSV